MNHSDYIVKRSGPLATREDALAVAHQILNGDHNTREKTREFEKAVAGYVGMDYAKATNSGTSALHLALLALEVKPGDEVILPTYICQSVLSAVNYTGATPILADIGHDTQRVGFNMTPETIKSHLSSKTKAIIVPHMFGVPADIKGIKNFDIPIIEDCAQALGATITGKKVGSFGDLSVFSFYSTKMISTGHGGMVATSSKELEEKIKSLTLYDGKQNYSTAYNYSMSDINAALGLSQLRQFPQFLQRREKIRKLYDHSFRDLFMALPPKISGAVDYRYPIMVETPHEMKTLQGNLKAKGIEAETPVYNPLHNSLMPGTKEYPNADRVHSTALVIPLYPALTDKQVSYVIRSVAESAVANTRRSSPIPHIGGNSFGR